MSTDQTDHRADADGWLANMLNATTMHNKKQAHRWVTAHLLAAIHDGQQEQIEWLHRIRDLLAVMAEPKGDPCPCGCRCDVEAKPHVHFWKPQQNVTSRGYAMPPIEVCDCGTARRATDPEPESVTVTLPRDVVEIYGAKDWRIAAQAHRDDQFPITADLLDAVADALDAASATQEAGK